MRTTCWNLETSHRAYGEQQEWETGSSGHVQEDNEQLVEMEAPHLPFLLSSYGKGILGILAYFKTRDGHMSHLLNPA